MIPFKLRRPGSRRFPLLVARRVQTISPILGVTDATEEGDSLVSTGAVAIAAVVSITEAGDTVTASGLLPLVATAALTDAADLAAGAGGVSVVAVLAVNEQDDTLIATSVSPIAAALAQTEDGDALSAAAAIAIAGAASLADADDVVSGTIAAPTVLHGRRIRGRPIIWDEPDETVAPVAKSKPKYTGPVIDLAEVAAEHRRKRRERAVRPARDITTPIAQGPTARQIEDTAERQRLARLQEEDELMLLAA